MVKISLCILILPGGLEALRLEPAPRITSINVATVRGFDKIFSAQDAHDLLPTTVIAIRF